MRTWALKAWPVDERIRAARCMYGMWQTADVRAKRAKGCTEEQRDVMARCEACGLEARTGFRSWHLIARCKHAGVAQARRRVRNAVLKVVKKHVQDDAMVRVAMLPWELDDEGCFLELEDPEELLAWSDGRLVGEVARRALEMCEVVRGPGGLERRQMAAKGMLGVAWAEHLAGWGLEEGVVWRLKEALLRTIQKTLPEVERVALEEEKCRAGEQRVLDEEEVDMFGAALARQAAEKWRGDEGREAREYVEALSAVRKLRWARGVLGRSAVRLPRAGCGAADTREAARRRSEAADGRAMDRWTGRKSVKKPPRWQKWWPRKGVVKRQSRLQFQLRGVAGGERDEAAGGGEPLEDACEALERVMCEVEAQRQGLRGDIAQGEQDEQGWLDWNEEVEDWEWEDERDEEGEDAEWDSEGGGWQDWDLGSGGPDEDGEEAFCFASGDPVGVDEGADMDDAARGSECEARGCGGMRGRKRAGGGMEAGEEGAGDRCGGLERRGSGGEGEEERAWSDGRVGCAVRFADAAAHGNGCGADGGGAQRGKKVARLQSGRRSDAITEVPAASHREDGTREATRTGEGQRGAARGGARPRGDEALAGEERGSGETRGVEGWGGASGVGAGVAAGGGHPEGGGAGFEQGAGGIAGADVGGGADGATSDGRGDCEALRSAGACEGGGVTAGCGAGGAVAGGGATRLVGEERRRKRRGGLVEAVEAGSGRRELRRQGGNKRAVRPDQGGASGRHLADKRGAESEGGGIECEGEARGQRRRTTEEKIGAGDMTRELG